MEYYPRKIEEKLDSWMGRHEVLIIKGPRQSGKTTLLLHLREKYGGTYVTLEDEDMLNSFEEAPKEFIGRFLKNDRTILFLDEAQYCEKFGKNIKLLFDLFSDKVKFIVTGSGSFDIKVEVGKYLVGRAIYFELFPLTFEEFLLWKAKDLYKIFVEYRSRVEEFILNGKAIDCQPVFQKEFSSLLEEYLLFGGFPAIVKEKDVHFKVELLKNLIRTYIEKDVFFFLNVREIEKFRKLANYLSLTIGSIIELSSLMREIGMDYRTLDNYISILLNTYIISLVPPYYKNLVTELKKAKKVYFNDTGLRNSIINNFLPLENRVDKGALLENFVYNELKSLGYITKYWRTTGKAEVDFIVEREGQVVPVEVKSLGKIKRGFVNFINTYKPKNALVLTDKDFTIKELGSTKVAYIPHFFI
ncbi:MAG: ATP-binding protein [Nitrososphaeria archaeon]|nr:ATP-binding protein [Nitrososphaeria archaeon]